MYNCTRESSWTPHTRHFSLLCHLQTASSVHKKLAHTACDNVDIPLNRPQTMVVITDLNIIIMQNNDSTNSIMRCPSPNHHTLFQDYNNNLQSTVSCCQSVHSLHQLIDEVLSVAVVTTLNEMPGLLSVSPTCIAQLERP